MARKPMRMALSILVWSTAALSGCSRSSANVDAASPELVPVRAVLATQADVPLELLAAGTVEPIASVEVRARVSGQVSAVHFQEGRDVRKGQPLFTINPDMLQRQAAEQKAQFARDEAAAEQARALVARDMANQRQSQSEANIAQALERNGILSKQRADQLTTTNAADLATLHADEGAAAAARAGTLADRARLSQTQLQLALTTVTAPISGRTGAVLVKPGNIARENDSTLVQLLQMAPISVSFGVPEQSLSEILRLNATSTLKVEAEAQGDSVARGSLVFTDNTVDAMTGSVRLKATFGNQDGKLWPGEFVNVRLRLRVDAAQTIVPSAAVQESQDGAYVWIVRNGVVRMQRVMVKRTYIPRQGEEWALVDNIVPGAEVITEGQLRLTDGSHVQLLAPALSVAR